MKSLLTTFVAGASLLVASQAYVVTMYTGTGCTGSATSRNVWDNTCAYTKGFKSLKLTTKGGGGQQLTAWSRNACAGPDTLRDCAAGNHGLRVGKCYQTTNSDGGSNALSSYYLVDCL